MRTVPLGGKQAAGRVALVDDEDYDRVMQHRWRLYQKQGGSYEPYVFTTMGSGERKRPVRLHTFLTGWPLTDHKDHNGLNNQRSNLRPATKSQNGANQLPRQGHSSRFKGVHAAYGKWAAEIKVNGQRTGLGTYGSELEAALAYDEAARHFFGEFAYPNFSDTSKAQLKVEAPRLCVICNGFIDPIAFCPECKDLAKTCPIHKWPRCRSNAVTCLSNRCKNALGNQRK